MIKSKIEDNKFYDKWLFLAIMSLLIFGSIMVISSGSFIAEYKFNNQNYFIIHQVTNALLGLVALILAMNLNYKNYSNKYLIYFGLIATTSLLLYLLLSNQGESIKGGKRWIFGFQPSELAKHIVVFFFAFSLNKYKDKITDFKKGYLVHLGILAVIVGLVYFQPDFSTSMMIFIIGYLLFYISGMKLLHLTATFVTILLPVIVVIAIIQPYRLDRFATFFSPDKDIAGKGWQVEQSLIGFGNGGFGGVGLGESRQKEFYLPEPHNDFIFSIIGDEFGYIGTVAVIILFILLIQRGFAIAKNAPDFYGFLLANGITIAIAVYAVFNMGITIGLVPPTGLPLPLVSYGGTSLIMTMFSLGVLLNISYKSNQLKHGNDTKIK